MRFALTALALGATMLAANGAHARRNGISASDCSGCHGSLYAAVDISASPADFQPGDDVTFTVTIRRSDGSAGVGGIFVRQPASGELRALAGEGLAADPGYGLFHAQPKPAQDGAVTFRFAWRAPAEPSGMALDVAVVAGNGDGRQTGDQAGWERYVAAFGCTGVTYYVDLDRDGYGLDSLETLIGCAGASPPDGYATAAGDCNDNDAAIHPGATEKCNKKDDDCDGEVDDDSEPVELWPDPDGDGYYGARTGTPTMGCSGLAGLAAEGGDCRPDDPDVYPGATEVCNQFDDNCDGRADERARPQCGEGRCRRESNTCDAADCVPGEPQPERCNYLDDDCNGVIDDGTTCPEGSECFEGKCVTSGGGSAAGAGGAGATGGSSSAAGSGAGPLGGGGPGDPPDVTRVDRSATSAGCSVASAYSPSHPERRAPPLGVFVLGLLSASSARRSRRAPKADRSVHSKFLRCGFSHGSVQRTQSSPKK